jgi:hypothetical protein
LTKILVFFAASATSASNATLPSVPIWIFLKFTPDECLNSALAVAEVLPSLPMVLSKVNFCGEQANEQGRGRGEGVRGDR